MLALSSLLNLLFVVFTKIPPFMHVFKLLCKLFVQIIKKSLTIFKSLLLDQKTVLLYVFISWPFSNYIFNDRLRKKRAFGIISCVIIFSCRLVFRFWYSLIFSYPLEMLLFSSRSVFLPSASEILIILFLFSFANYFIMQVML